MGYAYNTKGEEKKCIKPFRQTSYMGMDHFEARNIGA
jgi:hypothetical protein